MLDRGSPTAVLIGRWGMALSLIVGAVLLGRIVRAFPYYLPNRLPGLLLYELGPGLVLGLAIVTAIAITNDQAPRFVAPKRLALFIFAAIAAGVVVLGFEFNDSLRGQWL
ncbi:hypothetical protein [Sphingomonas sp. CCH18-H6]|jgi:hypothetical protein|nr:hypothetical protein [Sphingomonas sp. CCH18-H6]